MHQHYSDLILLQVQPFDDSFLIEEKCQRNQPEHHKQLTRQPQAPVVKQTAGCTHLVELCWL